MLKNSTSDASVKDFAISILRTLTGEANVDFRPGQWEALCDTLENPQRTLLIQNPGWGKSLVYLAATKLNRMAGKGPTIVISPLTSLMRNQCAEAQKCGLSALTLSSQKASDWDLAIERIQRNEVDILFIVANHLANDSLFEKLITSIIDKASLLVVDEAHCISAKSHDFRPSYRKVPKLFPFMYKDVKVLATTGTADGSVVEDIKSYLGDECKVSRGEWYNTNLSLDTVQLPNEAAKYAWLVNVLKSIRGSGIIYTRSYREADSVARWLRLNKINAVATTGILPPVEARFRNNEIKALVTPGALSIGFDKPDIAFVIHLQKPNNLAKYFQQVGRAGRKISKAHGIMLASEQDVSTFAEEWQEPVPTKEDILAVSSALPEGVSLSVDELQKKANLSMGRISATLEYLATESSPPIAKKDNKWKRTDVPYVFKTKIVNSLKELRRQERSEVENYFNSSDCKYWQLRKHVGCQNNQPCGKCSSCLGVHLFPIGINEKLLESASLFLAHDYIGFSSRSLIPKGVLENYVFSKSSKVPDVLKHENGWILSDYGEGTIGKTIQKEREEGHFSDELVKATAEMINSKGLSIEAKWVTCVPHKGSEIVASFAKRVADELNLPFHDVFERKLDDESYQNQRNSAFRLRNLDGNFVLKNDIPYGSAILIDDLFDTGWTFFVASALLRQKFIEQCPTPPASGVPKVFPVALGTTSVV